MQTIQELKTDFKAEVVAVSLLRKHQDQDLAKVIIDRLGNGQRGHTKDLYGVAEIYNTVGNDAKIAIQSFRQSIYDSMPENVFHPPTLGGVGKSSTDIVAEIKLQRKREQEARKFFKPFEQEISYIEMQYLLAELRYDNKVSYGDLLHVFEEGWPILKKLPLSVRLAFVYVLPILNEVRGDSKWIANCLSFVLGFKVTINRAFKCGTVEKTMPSFKTGSSYLGINTCLKGQQYDGFFSWEVCIGPVKQEEIAAVLPESGFTDLLEVLAEETFPSGVFVDYIVDLPKHGATILSDQEDSARLGYSFYL